MLYIQFSLRVSTVRDDNRDVSPFFSDNDDGQGGDDVHDSDTSNNEDFGTNIRCNSMKPDTLYQRRGNG